MMTEERRKGGVGGGDPPSAAFQKVSLDESSSSLASSTTAIPKRRIIVKSADMKEDMQQEAIDCAVAAFEKHGVEKDIAEYIKKEFDKNHGSTWHCIVGRNFGSAYFYPALNFVFRCG